MKRTLALLKRYELRACVSHSIRFSRLIYSFEKSQQRSLLLLSGVIDSAASRRTSYAVFKAYPSDGVAILSRPRIGCHVCIRFGNGQQILEITFGARKAGAKPRGRCFEQRDGSAERMGWYGLLRCVIELVSLYSS